MIRNFAMFKSGRFLFWLVIPTIYANTEAFECEYDDHGMKSMIICNCENLDQSNGKIVRVI